MQPNVSELIGAAPQARPVPGVDSNSANLGGLLSGGKMPPRRCRTCLPAPSTMHCVRACLPRQCRPPQSTFACPMTWTVAAMVT